MVEPDSGGNTYWFSHRTEKQKSVFVRLPCDVYPLERLVVLHRFTKRFYPFGARGSLVSIAI
jgi:hypothetical protein